jgi:hypothetical protein
MNPSRLHLLAASALFATLALPAGAGQCPPVTPIQGAQPRQQIFPADNWWNTDITYAPVDPDSDKYIAYINDGGSRTLHPEFGGTVRKGGAAVYGYPYAIVDATTPRLAVKMKYADESDGVDHKTGKSFAFYPIPPEAITEPHWIEGGAAGDIDQRRKADRHMIILDCANNGLYELYNVYYDLTRQQWFAGSGAHWDMDSNDMRPEGWTSGEASGLQMFPGMVRYDEAWNDNVPEIAHALRVTLRATDGHVYPATHTDATTRGALPFGARLRLKASVDGKDPALRTSDPHVRKIFRAMQHYGLIFSSVGTDMYISGSFDVRWDNGILTPAFENVSA